MVVGGYKKHRKVMIKLAHRFKDPAGKGFKSGTLLLHRIAGSLAVALAFVRERGKGSGREEGGGG